MPSRVTLDQDVLTVGDFTLESGIHLTHVPVAYKTWGSLDSDASNAMVICHAFTGSADVEDWWGPLMGQGRAFDPSRYFIFCANVLGSPYGTASPVTVNPQTGALYGPEFPLTTVRDDVRLHKVVLDHLGVKSVAVAIGGSMGGMAVLEWPLCTPPGYVRHVVPIATAARHSAWCISWGEAQRQSIYSDPEYNEGYYLPHQQPNSGLAAARMAALLTYRTRDSFERRFGRKPQNGTVDSESTALVTPPQSPSEASAALHNDGNRTKGASTPKVELSRKLSPPVTPEGADTALSSRPGFRHTKTFSAQGYLRYQGDKFTARFDANCYIHITRKMDTHDVARGRTSGTEEASEALAEVLARLPGRALVIGIETDGLFLTSEQRELAEHIPESELVIIDSADGHDGFLLEFEQINVHLVGYLRREMPELYATENATVPAASGFAVGKTSVFGEAESELDVTRW